MVESQGILSKLPQIDINIRKNPQSAPMKSSDQELFQPHRGFASSCCCVEQQILKAFQFLSSCTKSVYSLLNH